MFKFCLKIFFLIFFASSLFGQQTAAGDTADEEARRRQAEFDLTAGQTAPTDAAAEDNSAGSLFTIWDTLRMIVILLLVVAAIYLLLLFLRRGNKRKYSESATIALHGERALTDGNVIHVVEVGGKVFLIGSSSGGTSLLHQFGDQESIDSIRLAASEQAASGGRNFRDILSKFFPGSKMEAAINKRQEFMTRQRKRLDEIS